jgi:hypothetical protein
MLLRFFETAFKLVSKTKKKIKKTDGLKKLRAIRTSSDTMSW